MVNDTDKILIDRYLRNELTQVEVSNLERRINQDKDLEQYLFEMKVMTTAMKSDVLKDKMKMLKGLNIPDETTNVSSKKMKPWILIVALLAFLGLVSLWWNTSKAERKPSVQYAEMFGDDFTEMYVKHKVKRSSNLGELTAEQSRAYTLYSAKEFDRAIPYLKKLWEEQQDSLAYYYLGVSYLGVGEDELGEEVLGEEVLDRFDE